MDKLSKAFQGESLQPGDAGYDEARMVWNGMVDKRPALIARCTGTSDVVAAVNHARDNGLLVAVRGGGHNVAGLATCDGGILIDLSLMKKVTVDTGRRTASAEGGVTWGEYDAETQRHGLASPGGAISTTGIAGLTLGGGFGWLSRSYGLACDNVVSAEIVTAEGKVLKASAEENPDLFWGIRGGGGNFGVVTRFEYRLQPLKELFAGLVLYPRDDAVEFLELYSKVASEAPDELSTMAAMLSTPDGVPVVGVFCVYNGPQEDGERVLNGLRTFKTPLHDDIEMKPYTVVQQAFDPGFPRGLRNYWKSSYLSELGSEGIGILVDHANRAPSPMNVVGIEHMLGGAVARVGADETAFGARDAEYNLLILAMAEDAGLDETNRQWARDFHAAVRPFSTGAVYVNYMDQDEAGRIDEAYGPNYSRLVELKKRYDPRNLFRRNQNIAPAG